MLIQFARKDLLKNCDQFSPVLWGENSPQRIAPTKLLHGRLPQENCSENSHTEFYPSVTPSALDNVVDSPLFQMEVSFSLNIVAIFE